MKGMAAEAHSALQIPLSMFVVFASAKLLAEVFERLGQPGIVGEIIAGILIGPHVLGWMAPNEVLTILADLGVMFLLFRVGLEVKASELMSVGGTALLTATAGVSSPLLITGEDGSIGLKLASSCGLAARFWPEPAANPPPLRSCFTEK